MHLANSRTEQRLNLMVGGSLNPADPMKIPCDPPKKQKAAAAVGEVKDGHDHPVHHHGLRHHRSHLFHCKIAGLPALLAHVRWAMRLNIDVLM
jgi:hypothetical protein